jgi:hypothetical protein
LHEVVVPPGDVSQTRCGDKGDVDRRSGRARIVHAAVEVEIALQAVEQPVMQGSH